MKFLEMIKQKIIYQMILFICLMSLIMGMYYVMAKRIYSSFEIREDDYSWMYQIDAIEEKGKNLVLTGWAFEINKDIEFKDYSIVLYEKETGKIYDAKMKYKVREDIDNYFSCDYDYSASGFVASIPIRKLDLEQYTYEVLLRRKGYRSLYSMETYYSNSQMLFVDPVEFVPLDVEGTALESVVTDGCIRLYCPNRGLYVYQYDEELYWITDDEFEFPQNNDMHVEFQLYTSQAFQQDMALKNNNILWDNLGFNFGENELRDFNTGKYRVTKYSIPKEYSTAIMRTGYYKGGWVWVEYFRPRIDVQ